MDAESLSDGTEVVEVHAFATFDATDSGFVEIDEVAELLARQAAGFAQIADSTTNTLPEGVQGTSSVCSATANAIQPGCALMRVHNVSSSCKIYNTDHTVKIDCAFPLRSGK